MTAPLNKPRTRDSYTYAAGVSALAVLTAVLMLVWLQFRGVFTPTTTVTMIAPRAGLSIDSGARVTFNGVQIGRVSDIEETTQNEAPHAKFTLEVETKYLRLIPANVQAEVNASTAFGNKYVMFAPPKNPVRERLSGADTIDATHTTTEFNTLFETMLSLAEKVDPIKLNATLSALAQALDGLGNKFGQSVVDASKILADLNPRMPQFRYDTKRLADLMDSYADASPDLWDFLRNAITTAHTLNGNQANLDSALMGAIGFGNGGAEILEKSGPFLVRGVTDLVPTARLLDEYSPELVCLTRMLDRAAPRIAAADSGYSIRLYTELMGGANTWVYPDNLPRLNAHGGPEGRPGCWAPITKDLWPTPYLVMDTGASLAPYNHWAIGTPYASEYVWGRQMGENTINP